MSNHSPYHSPHTSPHLTQPPPTSHQVHQILTPENSQSFETSASLSFSDSVMDTGFVPLPSTTSHPSPHFPSPTSHPRAPISPPTPTLPTPTSTPLSPPSSSVHNPFPDQNELIRERLLSRSFQGLGLDSFGPPEILPEDIKFEQLLGSGSYGTVFSAKCRGADVAVKIPLKQNLSEAELTEFRKEMEFLSKNVHRNVISLMGACTQSGKLQIVLEKCSSDLDKLLNDAKYNLTLEMKIRIAREIAQGMRWIHEISKIIHGDLKPANILLDAKNHVKITDFGFSQFKQDQPVVSQTAKGSLIWMAPEKILRKAFTEKVDVYSFAVILWEIITRRKPFSNYFDPQSFCEAVCYQHVRPPLDGIPDRIRELIECCWQYHHEHRPSFNDIDLRLSSILVDVVIEDLHAARFWKDYFFSQDYGLYEVVDWRNFVFALKHRIGVEYDEQSLLQLKQLLVENVQDAERALPSVTMPRFRQVVRWFGPFYSKEHGRAIIAEITALVQKEWFHYDISSATADLRLSKLPHGSFLVRLSLADPNSPFTISATNITNGVSQVLNVRVSRAPGGGFIYDGKVYASITEIVDKNRQLFISSPAKQDPTPVYVR